MLFSCSSIVLRSVGSDRVNQPLPRRHWTGKKRSQFATFYALARHWMRDMLYGLHIWEYAHFHQRKRNANSSIIDEVFPIPFNIYYKMLRNDSNAHRKCATILWCMGYGMCALCTLGACVRFRILCFGIVLAPVFHFRAADRSPTLAAHTLSNFVWFSNFLRPHSPHSPGSGTIRTRILMILIESSVSCIGAGLCSIFGQSGVRPMWRISFIIGGWNVWPTRHFIGCIRRWARSHVSGWVACNSA